MAIDPDGRESKESNESISSKIGSWFSQQDKELNPSNETIGDAALRALEAWPAGAEIKVGFLALGGVLNKLNKLQDGATLKTEQALQAASEFLGQGYKEISPGVFKSVDGTKMVRMTDADLAKSKNHAGAPHMNFETGITVTKPNWKESFDSKNNLHIYIKE